MFKKAEIFFVGFSEKQELRRNCKKWIMNVIRSFILWIFVSLDDVWHNMDVLLVTAHSNIMIEKIKGPRKEDLFHFKIKSS